MRRAIIFMVLLCLALQGSWTDANAIGRRPKARITDMGVVASDVMLWKVKDAETNKTDTAATTDTYILWESDGDIERQAEEHRSDAAAIKEKHLMQLNQQSPKPSDPVKQEGCLNWVFCDFHYYVFTFEYSSVDADGKEVTLSGIAACPPKGAKEVRDVVMGTHITITADSQRPSAHTKGFEKDDWGVLMSMAADSKMEMSFAFNAVTMGATFIVWPLMPIVTLSVDIAALVKSNSPAFNNNLVVMADYEGYGTTRNRAHPYLYQELTARQVVDATFAAIDLYKTNSKLSDIRVPIREDYRSIACGYSQGGSVAMATHRFIEQNDLVEDLHFVGSICGDGPYDAIATLMYYMKNDLEGKKMSMPVVLPLIVKGMLDTNPFMVEHRAEDYFRPEFLATGIMDWLTKKEKSTDDITAEFKKLGGKFDGDGKIMMRDIMTDECYAYFKKVYEQNKNTFTSKAGVPRPETRGKFEDLHLALASNDMTQGWTPQHAVMLYHSTDDTVVPYVNAESAVNRLGGWTVLNKAEEGHDHVEAGTDFYQGGYGALFLNFGLRAYVAKRQLCELNWKNQQKGAIKVFE